MREIDIKMIFYLICLIVKFICFYYIYCYSLCCIKFIYIFFNK